MKTSDQQRAVLDAMTIDEIEAYLEERRHEAYMSFGAEDGFERLVMEEDLTDLILPTGTWVARDKGGTIRLAFGDMDAPTWNRPTRYYAIYDEEGRLLEANLLSRLGLAGCSSSSSPDYLRQARAWLLVRFAELGQSGLS